ncbi:unnamed protein product [Brassicogethes aeneus]|uniref:N-acetylglucosaminylphosphatidylinositol deacetylase n=1 Tax=Brassicogethes aeneus TaxID=1431903 RepID=A0A9P0AVZ0_BRAAE|nr:unnamed protein product [Brassicogethes aeneus]
MYEYYHAYWHDIRLNFVILKKLEKQIQDYFIRTTEYLNNTLEHLIIFSLLYILLCILLYALIVVWKKFPYTNSIRKSKRVLFVTGHPDDEVMFFGPTILHFINNTDTEVYLMCLSIGQNYGKGAVRKKELYDSCKVLGIKEANIMVVTHTSMPDKIDVNWPIDVIGKIILNIVEEYDIDVLVTFDRHGVSNHPNHCSIYFSVANLIIDKQLPKYCSVYVLETVDIIRKYWFILDLPLTFLMSRVRYVVSCKDRSVIHKAMWQHKSQLVWFRFLYMYFSRYMLINSLQKMNLSDIELDLEIDD